jgi:hypothetical protein
VPRLGAVVVGATIGPHYRPKLRVVAGSKCGKRGNICIRQKGGVGITAEVKALAKRSAVECQHIIDVNLSIDRVSM